MALSDSIGLVASFSVFLCRSEIVLCVCVLGSIFSGQAEIVEDHLCNPVPGNYHLPELVVHNLKCFAHGVPPAPDHQP